MGIYFTDNFSLLHFSSGIIAYYWNITFFQWFILHIIYELFQNSAFGIWFINNVITVWPGGKLHYDSYINIIGDQIYGLLGWIFTHFYILYFYKGVLHDVPTTK
jgi:hypothetical protein